VSLMQILLDEMYSGLKDYLEVLGWSVVTIQDLGLSGMKDRRVVDYADEHDLILVTQDQKPAELADLVDVRNLYMSNALVARAVDREIREKYPDIEER
jgi:predicted nuclease of predicted toxin-antitoxin system